MDVVFSFVFGLLVLIQVHYGQITNRDRIDCALWKEHYIHHCLEDSNHARVYLDEEIRKICFAYSQRCPYYPQGNSPRSTHIFASQQEWHFSGLNPESTYLMSNCIRECKDPQCLLNCECTHYKEPMVKFCNNIYLQAPARDNCIRWHQRCSVPYKPPPKQIAHEDSRYFTQRNKYDFDYIHRIKIVDRDPTVIDWVNGRLHSGWSFWVPIVGVGGGQSQDIGFPSLGQVVRGTIFPRRRKRHARPLPQYL